VSGKTSADAPPSREPVVADEPAIHDAAEDFRALGTSVDSLEADLATIEGVDQLYATARGRPVEALLANAGRAWAKPSSIRISMRSGTSSTPTLQARSA
jgi:hypothetical protein